MHEREYFSRWENITNMKQTLEQLIELRISQLKEDNATMIKAIDFGDNDATRIVSVAERIRSNSSGINELELVMNIFKQGLM